MPTIVNPKDTTALIQLNEMITTIDTEVGFISRSGLFEEELTPRDAVIDEIQKHRKTGMVGLTSRREGNKVKVAKGKTKQFALQIPYMAMIDQITKEDVHQVATSWSEATELQITDLYIDKATTQREAMDKSLEFMMWTASQGKTLNPEDGSVVVDMFDLTETERPVEALDLTDVNLNLLLWMGSFRNRVLRENKRGSNNGIIEIFVTEAVFNKFVGHNSVIDSFNKAYNGRGDEYYEKLKTFKGTTARGIYGTVMEFEHNGVRLVVAPQDFTLENEEDEFTQYPAVPENEGFAIVRGIRGAYKAMFSQNSSLTDNSLSKFYASRSAIKDDSYFDFNASSAPIAYTTIPELCYKLTFKVA